MGLTANGDHGVKAYIKHKYSRAARTYASLGDIRQATKTSRNNVVVALDGNVLMMQVPQKAATFSAYTGIVTNAIRSAMGSAAVVVVVFDDPAYMTAAKREEQTRRDAARKKTEPVCSVDLFPYPTDDNYGIAELTGTTDCHAIVKCRASRQRFFDETGRQILLNLKKSIASWAQGGAESTVIFDGLDPRGAQRPYGEPRETQIYGSNETIAALFQRDEHMGEGDLKLAWVEQRARELAESGDLEAKLHMTVTIDTDSIAIELMEEARRRCGPEPDRPVMGVLCMRERQNKRDAWDDDPGAVYWAVDYASLFELIQNDLWGLRKQPSHDEARMATALMCAGWALAGCDFCKVAGLNADMVMQALPSYLHTAPGLLGLMPRAWSGDREAAKGITDALRRLVLLCAGNYGDQPRARKATVENMRNHDNLTLLRACWTTAYWSKHEFRGDLSDFGFTAIYDGQYSAAKAPKKQKAEEAKEPKELNQDEPPPSVVSKYFSKDARAQDRVEKRGTIRALSELAWSPA